MSKKQKNNGSNSILELVRNNSVPLMFIIICAVCIPISGFSPGYLLNEIVTRLGRNAFLILSLLIPIMAGMGLNFGMTPVSYTHLDVYKRQWQQCWSACGR